MPRKAKSPTRIQETIIGGATFRGREAGRCHRTTRGGWLQGATMACRRPQFSRFKLAHGFRADSYTVNATVPLGKQADDVMADGPPNGSA